MNKLNPSKLAEYYRDIVNLNVKKSGFKINLVGFLATAQKASKTYAEYTAAGCESVGINFELRVIDPLDTHKAIAAANKDSKVHGIFIYYPIFSDANDYPLKDLIDHRKDIEGLSKYWVSKLYSNERFDDKNEHHKSIVPCTSLAIVKMLETLELHFEDAFPLKEKTITIFNRSDVVGKPLASMLSNDGAEVFSFDENGGLLFEHGNMSDVEITRDVALKNSDIVITGVPSHHFNKIHTSELKKGVISLNFSTVENFTEEAKQFSDIYIPRVGPLTVAMCLRNALRLYKNYHLK